MGARNIIVIVGLQFLFLSVELLAGKKFNSKNGMTLFQGDIMFRNGTSIYDRNAMRNQRGRWASGVIYYSMDDTFGDDDKDVILSAIKEIEDSTCLKWVERTDEEDFVELENDMGCWSELGRIGGVQSLSLESPQCMQKGVILHELMHAAGFLHEMSRSDRDDYVRVLWDNIIPGMEDNFIKLSSMEINDLGLEYDYRSVMHYTAWSFSQDRRNPTLEPVDQEVSLSELGYGHKHGVLTDLDIKKIQKFYEC